MISNRSKELDSLLKATRKFIDDEFDNSCGDLMGLYEAHRDYVEDGDGDVLDDFLVAVFNAIEHYEFVDGIDALLLAYEDYKASL